MIQSNFSCWVIQQDSALPFDQCECCSNFDVLLDCEPEIAWPNRWLCHACAHEGERMYEQEKDWYP